MEQINTGRIEVDSCGAGLDRSKLLPSLMQGKAHTGARGCGQEPDHKPAALPPATILCAALVLGLAMLGCSGSSTAPEQYPVVGAGKAPESGRLLMDLALGISSGTRHAERRHMDPADPTVAGMLGTGWARPERHGGTGETFVWATATTATLSFELVGIDHEEIHLRCWPYRFPGAEDQKVGIVVNLEPIGEITLDRGVRTYSLDLPEGVLQPGTNEVELHFAYAKAPREIDPERRDSRTLAAAVLSCSIGKETPGSREADGQEPRLPRQSSDDHGPGIMTPAGSAIIYDLIIPPSARLELGYKVTGTNPVGEIWVEPEQGLVRTVLNTRAFGSLPDRWAVDLSQWEGQQVRLGLTARQRRGRPDPATGVTWHRPCLTTQDEQLDGQTNVILIVVDTLRADLLSCYGGEVQTPTIDSLAARGALFERAASHIPITGPSHSSIFVSKLPAEHGVHNNTQVLDGKHLTLAEVLGSRYRHTAAFVSLGVLKGKFGLDQGFDEYHDRFGQDWFKKAPEMTDALLEWLDTNHQAPFFLWAHYSDPHEPYAPPGLDYPRMRVSCGGREVAMVQASGRTSRIPLRLEPGLNLVRFEATGGSRGRPIRFRSARVPGQGFTVEPGDGFGLESDKAGIEGGTGDGRQSFLSDLPATLRVHSTRAQAVEAELLVLLVEQLDVSETRRRYGLEVEALDRELARLVSRLDELDLLERSVIVLTGDHGESLGEHRHIGHISQLYEPLTHIPLIIVAPGRIEEQTRLTSLVSHLDLAPTVLDLLNTPIPPDLRGRSLLPLIRAAGDDALERDGAFQEAAVVSETYKPESPVNLKALMWSNLKYILNSDSGRRELYDLAQDPDELHDLSAARPEVTRTAHERLLEILAQVEAEGPASSADLSEEDRSQLEALGYIH